MNRILIAEDEERIASFVQKGLRANGFTTVVAEDGDLALGHALTGGFDLMVLDIGLPGRDGFTVLREMRGAASRCRSSCSPPATPCGTRWPGWRAGPTTG